MTEKNRCVRINYAGDFHVDVIPSTRSIVSHRPYAVPARDLSDWITNDPFGFIQWVKEKNTASGMVDSNADGAFARSVRTMKRWRDHFFGTDSRPSSILLTTILGKHEVSVQNYTPPLDDPLYPENQHASAYLYDLLRLTHGCIQHPYGNAFEHPTISGEDLRRGWDADFEKRFLERLAATIKYLKSGIDSESDASAAHEFQRALGETFPLE